MEKNHPFKALKSDVFLTLTCQLTISDFGHFLTLKVFYHQIIANLPYNETEIVGFLKRFEIWGFLKKLMFFFKRNLIFSKSLKMANLP